MPVDIKLYELSETNKKLYIQFELAKLMKTHEVEFAKSNKPHFRSVFDALMHPDKYYPDFQCNPNTNDMRQCNAVVTYFESNKFGVHPNSLSDFEVFVKHLCSLLWETDPNYEKFKARQCAFSNVVK